MENKLMEILLKDINENINIEIDHTIELEKLYDHTDNNITLRKEKDSHTRNKDVMSEVYFLKEELANKNNFIKSLLDILNFLTKKIPDSNISATNRNEQNITSSSNNFDAKIIDDISCNNETLNETLNENSYVNDLSSENINYINDIDFKKIPIENQLSDVRKKLKEKFIKSRSEINSNEEAIPNFIADSSNKGFI